MHTVNVFSEAKAILKKFDPYGVLSLTIVTGEPLDFKKVKFTFKTDNDSIRWMDKEISVWRYVWTIHADGTTECDVVLINNPQHWSRSSTAMLKALPYRPLTNAPADIQLSLYEVMNDPDKA